MKRNAGYTAAAPRRDARLWLAGTFLEPRPRRARRLLDTLDTERSARISRLVVTTLAWAWFAACAWGLVSLWFLFGRYAQ